MFYGIDIVIFRQIVSDRNIWYCNIFSILINYFCLFFSDIDIFKNVADLII